MGEEGGRRSREAGEAEAGREREQQEKKLKRRNESQVRDMGWGGGGVETDRGDEWEKVEALSEAREKLTA